MTDLVRPAVLADLPRLTDIYNWYVEHSYATFDEEPVTAENRRAWFGTFETVGPHRLLVERLTAEPVHSVLAAVALPNDASMGLHLARGFREVGTFNEYASKGGQLISSTWFEKLL